MGLRENLWHDKVGQLELGRSPIVSPQDSVRTTLEAMRQARTGCALVCQGDVLRGIFTERDLIKRVLAVRADVDRQVWEFMTPDPVTTSQGASIGSAIRAMRKGHYRHLPVVDEPDRPIGTIAVKRIFQYIADHFPSAVYNLPPQPRQVHNTREGA